MEINYNKKYLKYKNKYLSLKNDLKNNQKGGGGGGRGGDKINLMLFKAQWCGHCKSFQPIWNTISNNTKLQSKFNFITYDSEKNSKDISKWNIKGYPTVLIDNNNDVTEYNGPRDIEYLYEHLESL